MQAVQGAHTQKSSGPFLPTPVLAQHSGPLVSFSFGMKDTKLLLAQNQHVRDRKSGLFEPYHTDYEDLSSHFLGHFDKNYE